MRRVHGAALCVRIAVLFGCGARTELGVESLGADANWEKGDASLDAPSNDSPDSRAAADALDVMDDVNPVSSEPCRSGGDSLYIDGFGVTGVLQNLRDNHLPIPYALTGRPWTPLESRPDAVSFAVSVPGIDWNVAFSSRGLHGDLASGMLYSDTRTLPEPEGHPGLDVLAGFDCDARGWFRIENIAWSGDKLIDLLATFEQSCAVDTGRHWGCFHYAAR